MSETVSTGPEGSTECRARYVFSALLIAMLLFVKVTAQDHSGRAAGVAEPAVVIQFFADLDSAPASHAAAVVRALLERYPQRLAVDFHPRPADGQLHPADVAVVAAAAQQRGWQMAELLLANQDRRHGRDFAAMARQLELDTDRFAQAMSDEAGATQVVKASLAEAARLKVPKDAFLFVNDEPVPATIANFEAKFGGLLGEPTGPQ